MTTDSNSIPDEIMKAAEQALDSLLCNCPESCGGTEGLRAASILAIATAIHDAVMAESERCIDVARKTLVDARMGEIDTDLRCIAHILENRMKEHAAPPKAGGE